MPIKLGSTDVTKAYVGSSLASKVYLGNTQVWPTVPSGPPAFIATSYVCSLPVASDTMQVTSTYPTGTSSGHFVIAAVHCGDFDLTPGGSVSNIAGPTGWTRLNFQTLGEYGFAMFWKFSAGESNAQFTGTRSTSSGDEAAIAVTLMSFSGVNATSPINTHAAASPIATAFGGDIIAPSVTTTQNQCAVVHLSAFRDSTGGITCTWTNSTERSDNTTEVEYHDQYLTTASTVKDTAGATLAATVNPGTTVNDAFAQTYALTPA